MVSTIDNYDLSEHNTFGMKVRCARFIEYDRPQEIPEVLRLAAGLPRHIHIGSGSNLLFTQDYDGAVLHCRAKGIKYMDMIDRVNLVVDAGMKLDDLVRITTDQGLWGLENLASIPGEVGAAVVQNAGAYGTEMGYRAMDVHAFDKQLGDTLYFPQWDCDFGCRTSMFKAPENKGRYIVHTVELLVYKFPCPNLEYPALKKAFEGRDPKTLTPAEVRDAVAAIRRDKLPDPAVVPSAGSYFKNPVVDREVYERVVAAASGLTVPHYDLPDGKVKIPAAWLIERCGWKGKSLGPATVWHNQPLVITNPDRKAQPSDIIALEQAIAASVLDRFGIELTPEVEKV